VQETQDPQVVLDVQKMQLNGRLASVHVGAMEVLLIKGLAEAPSQKLDYWRMLELLGKEATEKNKASLGVQIHRLKQKIMEAGGEEVAIKSVFNEGYQLVGIIQII